MRLDRDSGRAVTDAPATGPRASRDAARRGTISELEVQADLSLLEREWLVGRLIRTPGVQEVLFRPDESCKVVVEHDARLVDTPDLLELLRHSGLRAHAA